MTLPGRLRFLVTIPRRAHQMPLDPWLEVELAPGWIARARLDTVDGAPVVAELRVTPTGELPDDGLKPTDLAPISKLQELLSGLDVEQEIRRYFGLQADEPILIREDERPAVPYELWPFLREHPRRPAPPGPRPSYYAETALLYERCVSNSPNAPSRAMVEILNQREGTGELAALRGPHASGPTPPWDSQKVRDLVRLLKRHGYLERGHATEKARVIIETLEDRSSLPASERWSYAIVEANVELHD